MPVRDLLIVGIVVASLPVCFVRPFFGVLMWTWVSFMSPHRLAWGFAYDLPLAQMVAVPTLAGLVFGRDRRAVPFVREAVLLGAFWILVTLTTVFAMFPDRAWPDLQQFSKILLMTFVTVLVCQERARVRLLLLVAVLSVGFYGLKGALFGLATGGAYRVYGPDGSFIGDNNGLGLGLTMITPLALALAREERGVLRALLLAVFAGSIVSVVLTYSRGDWIAIGAVLLVLVARSRSKLLAAAVAGAGAVALVWFLPEQWFDRLASIAAWEQDSSALGRLQAWQVAWNVALEHPLLGGGFRVFGSEVWQRYLPAAAEWHNAHSIYFHVLAEHGFTGLLLFLTLAASTLLTLRRVVRIGRRSGARWLVHYAQGTSLAMLGFFVAGAFQNLTYFDVFWFLIGVAILLRVLAHETAVSVARGVRPLAPATAGRPPAALADPALRAPSLRPGGA